MGAHPCQNHGRLKRLRNKIHRAEFEAAGVPEVFAAAKEQYAAWKAAK